MDSQKRTVTQLTDVDIIDLPFIPPQVNINDLDPNLRLIPKNKSDVFIVNNEPHVIYSGEHTIAKNGRTIVRVAQNINTGKWEVCKFIDPRMFNQTEIDVLQKMNQFIAQVDSMFLIKYTPGVRLDNILTKSNHYHTTSEYLEIASQLLSSLQTLHHKDFAHRDLHGGNILYDLPTHKLSIIDFGRAEYTKDIFAKKTDLQRVMWHLQTCLRKSRWLKQHATSTFKDTYTQINHIYSQHDLDAYYIKLRKKLRFLKNHLPQDEMSCRIGLLDISELQLHEVNLEKLKTYSAIWLTDQSHSACLSDLLQYRQLLCGLGLCVGHKVVKHAERWGLKYHTIKIIRERQRIKQPLTMECYSPTLKTPSPIPGEGVG